jgi:aminoglycoside phosphotransferase (APT) family kinase protein
MGFVPLNGETMQMLEKSPQSGLSSRSNIAHCLAPATISDADRDAPSASFIECMRERFPTEREIDLMLNRKMKRRAGPPFLDLSLARVTEYVNAFLRAHVAGDFSVSDQKWFSGGASKIQMGFQLTWNEPGVGRTTTRLVVRMEPTESMNSTSRLREFQVLKAFAGTVPVPRVYWVDDEGKWFPEPALIYAFAEGVTKPRLVRNDQISGTGTNFGPELRKRLAPQFVRHLAAIHSFDSSSSDLSSFDRPSVGSTESALWQFNRARRVWEEDRGEDLPFVEVAANWLERNLPVLDRVSVVHGDYRSGNFLFREEDAEITAVLDWERGYLGDRHRDLAWATAYPFGHVAEDGKTFLVSGLMPLDAFCESYEKQSGLTIDPKRMQFFKIFNCYQLMLSTLGTGYRVVRQGKSHQDIVLSWAGAAGYSFAEPLRQALEEVL